MYSKRCNQSNLSSAGQEEHRPMNLKSRLLAAPAVQMRNSTTAWTVAYILSLVACHYPCCAGLSIAVLQCQKCIEYYLCTCTHLLFGKWYSGCILMLSFLHYIIFASAIKQSQCRLIFVEKNVSGRMVHNLNVHFGT